MTKRGPPTDGGVTNDPRSQRRMRTKTVAVFATLVCLLVSLGLIAPLAHAAFPGRNGRIAYQLLRETGESEGAVAGGSAHSESAIESVLPSGRRQRTLLSEFSGSDVHYWDPVYRPDGRKLALAFTDTITRPSLYLVRTDGRGRLRRLTHPPRHTIGDRDPSWAPDGRRLVFTRGSQIRTYRAGRTRRIGSFPGRYVDHPAWSVRGQIAFSLGGPRFYLGTDPIDGRPGVIYTMRPDGSHRRRVVTGEHPDWSPHGRWIVFNRRQGGIAIIRPNRRNLRVLTNDGRYPDFSPDGRHIVFVRTDPLGRQALVTLRLSDRRTRTVVRAPNSGPLPFPGGGSVSYHIFSPDWQPLPRRR